MRTARCELESLSPYGQSRYYETPKKEGEKSGAYEERTWRDRLHVNEKGNIFIPAMAFKNCLAQAAKYLSIPVEGKGGKVLYTKHFEAGVLVVEGIELPVKKEQALGEWLLVPSNGRKGGDGPKVKKCFPYVRSWTGTVEFTIFDDVISEAVFERVLKAAGAFIGIGYFRPIRGGYWGRFQVNSLTWEQM